MISRMDYKFQLSSGEIDKISEMTVQKLMELEYDKKDIIRIRLGIEEMLLDLIKYSEGNKGVFAFYQKWGCPYFEIKIRGEKTADIEEDEEFSEYSNHIMEGMGLKPETFHKKGWNYIRLKLRKKERNPMIDIVAAIVLASVIGFGSSILFPQSTEIMNLIVDPLLDTFLGILTTIAGPMIFVSVTWGILCIGDAATLGTIGKKMMLRFIFITFLLTIMSFIVGSFFFQMNFNTAEMDFTQFSKIYELILNIFPSNIIAPFYENNTMQIIIIAIPFGIAMLILEQKASVVVDLAEQLNLIVQYLMGLITKLIPLFVFLSLLQMFLSSAFTKLSGCWKLLLLIAIIPMAVIIILMMWVCVKYRIKMSLLVRKMMPTFLIALTTASSAAAFSANIECCENKFGIDKRITRFGIPLGMVIYMPTLAIIFILISMYMAEVYGVSISVSWIIIGILISSVLAVAVPPIPGGSLTCYTIIFAQLGISSEAIAVATIIDIIADFYCTATCMTFLQLELLLQSDSMNFLDRSILLRE